MLKTPLSKEDVCRLKIGDQVELSGTIVTARDAAHKYLMEGGTLPFELNVIYHCGPIVKGQTVLSAGPTTSIREEPYEADVIKRHKVRAIIGKGGMGERTARAMKDVGCVYLAAIGGAGALIAQRIKAVKQVYKLEDFGSPEAFWELEVEGMPLTVAMDAQGQSLYKKVEGMSKRKMQSIARGL
jgi:fumarate hydratase class I